MKPTCFVPDWLGWSAQRQVRHLVEAWVFAVSSNNYRRMRKRLIGKLKDRQPLTKTEQKQLPGLKAIGIVHQGELTPSGKMFLSGEQWEEDCHIPAKWHVDCDLLRVPYPPDWRLLWSLEAFVDPLSQGQYCLDEPMLHDAVQRGANQAIKGESLIEILETGLQEPAPDWLKSRLQGPKFLKVREGILLEFSDPAKLVELRKSRLLRRRLEELITPRHVIVKPWFIHRLAKGLLQRGMIANSEYQELISMGKAEEPSAGVGLSGVSHDDQPARRLSVNERSFLMSMILLADDLLKMTAAPPGLRNKLFEGLPMEIQSSAARRAARLLETIQPAKAWKTQEITAPAQPEVVERLSEAILEGETMMIVYKKPDQSKPEKRRVSPLLIEQRGSHTYLIAYCHRRLENRTFRLDRLTLVDPEGNT